jgi:hypothetical protein
MRRLIEALVVLATLSVLSGAVAQAPAAPSAAPSAAVTTAAPLHELPRPTNAALFFWRAWDVQPDGLMEKLDAEFNGRDLAWTPSAEIGRELEGAQGFVLPILRATEMSECDFGIEYALGRDMNLSHLDKMRATARVLVSDARRLQAEGKIDDTVRRVVGLYSMARLARQDRLTHASSTAQGFARMASDEVRRLCDAKVLSAGQREELRKAADALGESDPFWFGQAIAREGAVTYHFLTTRFSGVTAGRDLLTAIALGGEPEEIVNAISAMDAAALKAQAEKVKDYFTRVSGAWVSEDAASGLRTLEEKVLGLEFGPVGFLVCPGLTPALRNSAQQVELMREARAMLDGTMAQPVTGPMPPK